MGRRSYLFVTTYDVMKTCPLGGYLARAQGSSFCNSTLVPVCDFPTASGQG